MTLIVREDVIAFLTYVTDHNNNEHTQNLLLRVQLQKKSDELKSGHVNNSVADPQTYKKEKSKKKPEETNT